MASDLLKPGGRTKNTKFRSYIEALESAMIESGAKNLAEFSSAGTADARAAALATAAENALTEPRYKKNFFESAPKIKSALRLFDCAACDKCVEVCPNRANISYKITPIRVEIPKIRATGGDVSTFGTEIVEISRTRQVVHVDDFCNECGNCATFCVQGGRPYMDKPRLVLNEPDFASQDNVFKIDENIIRRRVGGCESSLVAGKSGYIYEDAFLSMELDNEFTVKCVTSRSRAECAEERSLRGAVEMTIMYNGIKASASQLLQ